jgi:hypothetical protein
VFDYADVISISAASVQQLANKHPVDRRGRGGEGVDRRAAAQVDPARKNRRRARRCCCAHTIDPEIVGALKNLDRLKVSGPMLLALTRLRPFASLMTVA